MRDAQGRTLSEEAADVVDTFVAAYPVYAERAICAVLAPSPDLAAALSDGGAWLRDELVALLTQPFDAQSRGPLEVFQEAMRFPTDVLTEHGVPQPDRQEVERTALPGDRYRLAPASSQDLGEDAWKAHIAWGASKAGALAATDLGARNPRRPSVVFVGTDPVGRAVAQEAAAARGLESDVWRNPGAVAAGLRDGPPLLVIVDLDHPSARAVISEGAATGARVVAVGSGVTDFDQAAVLSLGAAGLIERERLVGELPRWLPRLA